MSTISNDKTRESYRYAIRRLIRSVTDGTPTHALTRRHLLTAWRALEQEGISIAYVNQIIASWRSFYSYLQLIEERADSPAIILRAKKPAVKLQSCPTVVEVKKLWGWLLSPKVWKNADHLTRIEICRDRAILSLLIGLAFRNSALRALRRENFDIENRLITARHKRGDRITGWDDTIDRHLQPVLHGLNPKDYVFIKRNGYPFLTKNQLNEALAELCQRAGVKPYTAHAFKRFTITSTIDERGYEVAAELGMHEDTATTRIYDQNRLKRRVVGRLFDTGGAKEEDADTSAAGADIRNRA